jgi:CRISPR-associated protein Cas5d
VYGRYALFTDPLTKIGGEKYSYQVPTYEALKGVLSSVYWKPTFVWVIDRVRVMRQIRTQTRSNKPIKYGGGNDLSIYTYLEYQVSAHFEWNLNRTDLAQDRNEHKHHNVAKRMIERGGRRDVFLGTRECQGYVEPCGFGSGEGYYDTQESPHLFGLMLHGLEYPDEAGTDALTVRMWQPRMIKGVIEFTRPDDRTNLRRFIRKMTAGNPATLGLAEESLIELVAEEN